MRRKFSDILNQGRVKLLNESTTPGAVELNHIKKSDAVESALSYSPHSEAWQGVYFEQHSGTNCNIFGG